jgi:type VI secretion system protein ImpF
MGRVRAENLVTQSLMDRLTSYDDWPNTRNQSLAMFREGIKRDIEWLLNARRPHLDYIEKYKLAASSVFNYGLPDLSHFSSASANPESLLMSIRQTIIVFEPRVIDPHVALAKNDAQTRNLRFHVDGRLVFENAEEDISFDTLLEVASGEYEVK